MQPVTQGAHHIGLTVPDLARTQAFFIDTLGFEQLGEVPDYPAVFLSDGTIMVTLWQVQDRESYIPFDRKNVIGLHHFALKVGDSEALQSMYETLQKVEDVVIEFAPEPLGSGPAQHMMAYIPGGIRVEFLAAA